MPSFKSCLLLALFLLPADVFACSCGWAGPFLTVAPKEELIVRGKVLRYNANAMDIEVHEILKGDQKSKTVRIWGDNGLLCRPYVTSFPVGTEWVFAVGSNKVEGDYQISVCGEFAVKVEKENVAGRLTAASGGPDLTRSAPAETMTLKQFRERLKAGTK